MQFVMEILDTTIVELLSCVGMELTMFVVATVAYILFVGDGKSTCILSLLNTNSICCAPESPKLVSATAKHTPQKIQKTEKAKTSSYGRDNEHAVISSMRSCGRSKDLKGALAAFHSLKGNVSPQVYNCFIAVRLQCGDLNGALDVFQKIAASGTADVVTYNTVLKALLELGRTDDAHKLLREMAAKGLPASQVTFHELLNAEVCAGNQRRIWKVVDEMKAAGHPADVVTGSILAKCLKEGAHPCIIDRVMTLVSELTVPVDEVLLASLVEGCVRMKRLDLITKVIDEFKPADGHLKLSAPCYGSLIKAYGHAGDVSRMWELWREMKRLEVKATAITFGCMVDGLVTNNRVEDAWKLVNEVYADENGKELVNTIIYSTVLKGLTWTKNIDRVFQVFDEMTERGVACNVITYNTMIDACARSGAMERVPRLLTTMQNQGTEPDLVTYSSLVKGYSLSGDVRRAFQVLDGMKATGLRPDEIMYNVLLDGCFKESRVDEALELLQTMQESSVKPSNHTLSILVKLLGRARRLDQVFQVVEDLTTKYHFKPNIQVYTSLIQACLNNRQLDRAMQVHDRMLADAGCRPDEKAYSVLVRGCLQANGLNEALRALRSAYCLDKKNCVKGRTPGVEADVLGSAIMRLRGGSAQQRDATSALISELKVKHSLDVDSMIAKAKRSSKVFGNTGTPVRRS